MMFLPTVGEFTPNVNVQIQPYDGSLDDYIKLSLKQFESANLTMVQQGRTKDSGAVFEYRGEIQNRRLHWYAKAQKSQGRIYLVTATALEEHWNEVAPNLKNCVDSFACDNVAPAPPIKPAARP